MINPNEKSLEHGLVNTSLAQHIVEHTSSTPEKPEDIVNEVNDSLVKMSLNSHINSEKEIEVFNEEIKMDKENNVEKTEVENIIKDSLKQEAVLEDNKEPIEFNNNKKAEEIVHESENDQKLDTLNIFNVDYNKESEILPVNNGVNLEIDNNSNIYVLSQNEDEIVFNNNQEEENLEVHPLVICKEPNETIEVLNNEHKIFNENIFNTQESKRRIDDMDPSCNGSHIKRIDLPRDCSICKEQSFCKGCNPLKLENESSNYGEKN